MKVLVARSAMVGLGQCVVECPQITITCKGIH